MLNCARRALRAAESWTLHAPAGLVLAAALALGGCQTANPGGIAAAEPRGATVAFESIDGLPKDHFQTLVHDLNGEAQQRRLAVLPREQPSAYRVRGYFAASVEGGKTTISWVWDVFDDQQRRAFRISGSEDAKGRKAWAAVDDAMMQRIAQSSVDQLAAFLTSPDVAPGNAAPASEPRLALIGDRDDSSPEAAGIFRVSQPNVDPAENSAAANAVPLPPKRPDARTAALGQTVTLSALTR
jgi:hypothetical protein